MSLSVCQHCGRSFLNEKLLIHNRSCTADNPARRVTAKVDSSSNDEAEKKEPPKTQRPKSSVRRPLNGSSSAETIHDSEPNSSNNSPGRDSPHRGSGSVESLAGHLGGSAGRQLRASNGSNGNNNLTPKKTVSIAPTGDGQEDTIIELLNRVEEMESTVNGLLDSINDVKSIIEQLRKSQKGS